MFKDLKGVINGKTLVGVLLGIAFSLPLLVTELADMIPVPEFVLQLGVALGFFFGFFGINDAAEQSFLSIKDKLKSFFSSSPAHGLFLEVIIQVIEKFPELGLPGIVVVIGHILSAGLIVFGLKAQAVKARHNNAAVADNYKQKYKIAS